MSNKALLFLLKARNEVMFGNVDKKYLNKIKRKIKDGKQN